MKATKDTTPVDMVPVPRETLVRWHASLDGYHESDVPDTVATRVEIETALLFYSAPAEVRPTMHERRLAIQRKAPRATPGERDAAIRKALDYLGDNPPSKTCWAAAVATLRSALASPIASGEAAPDCDCGCNEPAFTEPMGALRFLSSRFKHAGVSEGVALSYARDIDAILARQPGRGCGEMA